MTDDRPQADAQRRRSDVLAAGTLSLGVLSILLVSGRSLDLLGSPARMALLLGALAVAAAFWASGRTLLVVGYVALAGLVLRWVDMPPGGVAASDVGAAINEAIGVWLGGGNPYDHAYTQTRPPGQPMPYPPGALLVHLPGHLLAGLAGVQWTQFAFAALAIGLLAWASLAGPTLVALPAMTLYAAAPNLALLATDGSNDTVTGTLLLAAVLVTAAVRDRRDARMLVIGGILVGLAMSTKQLALPIAVALGVVVLRRFGAGAAARYAGSAAILLAALAVPFLVVGPLELIGGLTSFLGVHDDIYGWNVWAMLKGFGITPPDREAATGLAVAVTAVVLATLALLPLRSIAAATLAGVVATVVILFAARWTTYAYFALVLPPLLAVPILAAGWSPDRGVQPGRSA